jgi:hypothetical protein
MNTKPKKEKNIPIEIENSFIEIQKKPIIEEVIAFEDDMLDPITFEDTETFSRPRSFDPTGFTEEELAILDMTAKNLMKAQQFHAQNFRALSTQYARS